MWTSDVFFTINPSDWYNPVCAFFTGSDVKIGLTDPDRSRLPAFRKRAIMANSDPASAARFFDTVVKAFIRNLLGSDVAVGQTEMNKRRGVLGDIDAHYCVTESQGRGSLHLHGLAWHRGGLRANEFMAKLKAKGADGEAFRLRVLQFWNDVIRETVPGGPNTDMSKRRKRMEDHKRQSWIGIPRVHFFFSSYFLSVFLDLGKPPNWGWDFSSGISFFFLILILIFSVWMCCKPKPMARLCPISRTRNLLHPLLHLLHWQKLISTQRITT